MNEKWRWKFLPYLHLQQKGQNHSLLKVSLLYALAKLWFWLLFLLKWLRNCTAVRQFWFCFVAGWILNVWSLQSLHLLLKTCNNCYLCFVIDSSLRKPALLCVSCKSWLLFPVAGLLLSVLWSGKETGLKGVLRRAGRSFPYLPFGRGGAGCQTLLASLKKVVWQMVVSS